jgi:hypothetical protein
MFLDIIQRLFLFKNIVSETAFCLRLQVKATELGPIDRASAYLRISTPSPGRVYKPVTAQTICASGGKTLK